MNKLDFEFNNVQRLCAVKPNETHKHRFAHAYNMYILKLMCTHTHAEL